MTDVKRKNKKQAKVFVFLKPGRKFCSHVNTIGYMCRPTAVPK